MMVAKLFVTFLFICIGVSCTSASNNYGFRICFRELEGSSQCQRSRNSCSGWSSNPSWTQPFRDDTDNRAGGCIYQWRIEAHPRQSRYHEYRLCFRETEGSSQCQGTRSSCTGWSETFPDWTQPFRDDTDNRAGGCYYQWLIESRFIWRIQNNIWCRVCFKETEGSSQCQGSRFTCSGFAKTYYRTPAWTSRFRDDTDNRAGGCIYQWYLNCW